MQPPEFLSVSYPFDSDEVRGLRRIRSVAVAFALVTLGVVGTVGADGIEARQIDPWEVGIDQPVPEGQPGPSPISRSARAVDESCIPHPPIRIAENVGEEGFVLVAGAPTYRPGSGVIGGSGTADDPYVIAGWCIDGSDDTWDPVAPDQDQGIHLESTDAHVVITDNLVVRNPDHGLQLSGVDNAVLEGNDVTDNDRFGVRLSSSSDTEVLGNRIAGNGARGLLVGSSSNVTVRDNGITHQDGDGVEIRFSDDVTLDNNTITDNGRYGVFGYFSSSNELGDNTIARNEDRAVNLWNANQYRIHGNVISDNRFGLVMDGSRDNGIQKNTISDNGGHGMFMVDSHENDIRRNVLADNRGDGLHLRTSHGNVVRWNDIEDNGDDGLQARYVTGSVDARANWWGHVTGPSGGVDDACTDAVADGSGDSIDTTSASVCFDPWLPKPNTDAGAG